jgi:Fic-DOC domain mobile mystery protein B
MTDGSKVPGATPGDDLSGLLQPGLTDRRFRDIVEAELIDRAYQKHVFRARPKKRDAGWLTSEFIRQVHRDMFGELWDWAGKYRTAELNMGIDWHQIPEQTEILCGDFKYWDSEASAMPPLEIAARLQSRLTRIHPFHNGNGRHARLITDIFFRSRDMKLPCWPQIQLIAQGDRIRQQYIAAMKDADKENYAGLIKFFEDCLRTL